MKCDKTETCKSDLQVIVNGFSFLLDPKKEKIEVGEQVWANSLYDSCVWNRDIRRPKNSTCTGRKP